MLEMSERESSDVRRNQQPAHKAPGRVEAKEPRSVKQKVGKPQQQWDAHRRPVLAEFRCVRGDACVAVEKTKRHVNQLLHSGAGDLTANNDHAVADYHTVMLEIPVYHVVAEYSERKTDPMFSLRVD